MEQVGPIARVHHGGNLACVIRCHGALLVNSSRKKVGLEETEMSDHFLSLNKVKLLFAELIVARYRHSSIHIVNSAQRNIQVQQ